MPASDALFKTMQEAVEKDGKALVKKVKGIYQFIIKGGSTLPCSAKYIVLGFCAG